MNSCKLKFNQNLLQLKKFKEHLESIKVENQKKVTDSVNSYFNKIYKIIKEAKELSTSF
jgi:hypothetical protein